MAKYASIVSAVVSFLVVFILVPWVIRFMRKIGLVVMDMNKKDKPLVPIAGGLAVMIGVFAGLSTYIFIRTFLYHHTVYLLEIFAAMTSILIISLVGFVDDLLIKSSKEYSIGLRQWQKPLLTLIAAVPLMVINAGESVMTIPFVGTVDFGILYPLLIIPIGVVGASNMVNMLAGFNGMEAGMALVYFGMLGLYARVNGSNLAALISLVIFFSLLAFFYYNKYPAKILPGDSLTYLMGAGIANVAIIGNIERAALIASIPFFIELILKLRGRLKVDSFGVYKDGKIVSKYKEIYSIPHIFTRTGKFNERQITFIMMFIELVFASLIWFV